MLAIALDPGAGTELLPGETLAVTITAEDIPAPGLFGFGFSLLFDSDVFVAAPPVIDPSWTGSTDVLVAPGSAGAAATLAGGSVGPSGFGIPLAVIVLTAVGLPPGPTPTTLLSLAHLTGPGDTLLFDGTFLDGAGSPGFLAATAEASVPEPRLLSMVLVVSLGLARRSLPRT